MELVQELTGFTLPPDIDNVGHELKLQRRWSGLVRELP